MEVEEVPKYINKPVKYVNVRHFVDAEYIFTAYILRKVGNKVFRQAELQDLKAQHSVIIVPLEDVIVDG